MIKIQELTIPNAVKDVDKRNSHSLLTRTQNDTVTLDDGLAIFLQN